MLNNRIPYPSSCRQHPQAPIFINVKTHHLNSLSLCHKPFALKTKIALLSLAFCVLCSCSTSTRDDAKSLMVSIQPLKYIVDEIVGGDLKVDVLVPPGSSPETYEPTPAQIKSAEKSSHIFTTGLIGFENALVSKMPDKERIVDLGVGVVLIEGSCSHAHAGDHHNHNHGHHHGVDPHIWTSPKALIIMAETAYNRIHELWPDSLSYSANYQRLNDRLLALDETVRAATSASERRSFMIFHPGLTYYARDYGLNQISIEHEGKEPSARQLREIVDLARSENISKVLYQSEFPRNVVDIAATEIGAEAVEIDILGYDVVANILSITDLIVTE